MQTKIRIGGGEGRILSDQEGPATLVRRNLLRQSIEMFQETPARIPTANSIRCTRYNTRKQQRMNECPIKSLEILEQSCYNKCIRAIGILPFHCTYVTTDQIVLYKVYKKKGQFTKVSCDATGSIAHKIGKYCLSTDKKYKYLYTNIFELHRLNFNITVRENGQKSQKIMLYTFVISDSEFRMPIYSMISSAHHMSHILSWFFEFIRFFDDLPDIFISDMSIVLLNSAAIAFANCIDMFNYCEMLFTLVKDPNDPSTRKLKHQIRIDVNHLVKHICNALKSKGTEQKQFFTRATCLLITVTDLETARRILNAIMVVAKSKTMGNKKIVI